MWKLLSTRRCARLGSSKLALHGVICLWGCHKRLHASIVLARNVHFVILWSGVGTPIGDGRWGGTRGARTGGLDRRKPSLKRSQWHPRHVEAQSASLRRASYFIPNGAAGAVAGCCPREDGLSDGMAVEAVGHQLDGAAISTMVFEAMAVTCRNRANFLNSMASGLSLETPFASGLRRRLMQRLWGKLSCHGGWAPSTGAACDHTNVATGRIRRFLRLYLACAYRLEAADTLHAIDRTQRDVFVALRVRFSRGHCLPVRRCRSFMAVRSGASDTGTARSVTKSECAVPLQAHDRTLFQSNIADSLCSQGAHFQSQGLVTHLLTRDFYLNGDDPRLSPTD